MDTQQLQARYGVSAHGNFAIKDTIQSPHPYMITERHVSMAADKFGGMLGEDAIELAEKVGARCGVQGCHLKYHQHETGLLVFCKKDLYGPGQRCDPELEEYLLNCKEKAEADKYVGFAFIKEDKS
jgi:hypothetical protein